MKIIINNEWLEATGNQHLAGVIDARIDTMINSAPWDYYIVWDPKYGREWTVDARRCELAVEMECLECGKVSHVESTDMVCECQETKENNMPVDKLKKDIEELKGDIAYLDRKLKRLKSAGRDDSDLEVRSINNILCTKENLLGQQEWRLAKQESTT